jgi:hypothetical protein
MTSADLSYCLVIFAASAAQCLVAVWAATSTRPWPLRALVACAAIVALIPIRAWWPALVFAMTAALTAAIVAAIRRWHRPPAPPGELGARRFQFRLAHLLILILFVAMVLGLFRHFQVPRWQVALMLPLLGLPLAPVIALAYHSVAGPARWKMAAALVLAIPLSAGLLVWFDVGQAVPIRRWIPPGNNSLGALHLPANLAIIGGLVASSGLGIWIGCKLGERPQPIGKRLVWLVALALSITVAAIFGFRFIDELRLTGFSGIRPHALPLAVMAAPLGALAAIVAVATWIARLVWHHPDPRVRRAVRAAILCAGAAALVPAGWLYWQLLWQPQYPPPRFVGAVNNYDRIAAICRELTNPPPGKAKVLVDEALTLLAAPSYVPAHALAAETRNAPEMVRGHDIMSTYLQLSSEMQSAARGGDWDRAADYALAAIRLDAMFHRGGTTGHADSTEQFARPGSDWLRRYPSKISATKAREVIQAIDRSLAERDDLPLLQARDRIQVERRMGWSGRLRSALTARQQRSPRPTWIEERSHTSELSLRAIQVLLAIQLFHGDHQRLPQNLSELTPHYLPALPLDPFSGQPFIYRPGAITFELYSVGPDRADDGGRFGRGFPISPGYDLDLLPIR